MGSLKIDLVDFYRHQSELVKPHYLGDRLNAMASLAEREGLRGKVQMIYIDPPVRDQVRQQLAGVGT